MTTEEALNQLTIDSDRSKHQTEVLIDDALCHGVEREQVAERLGLSLDELMERHGLCVKNAGKLASFRAPGGRPTLVDLDAD